MGNTNSSYLAHVHSRFAKIISEGKESGIGSESRNCFWLGKKKTKGLKHIPKLNFLDLCIKTTTTECQSVQSTREKTGTHTKGWNPRLKAGLKDLKVGLNLKARLDDLKVGLSDLKFGFYDLKIGLHNLTVGFQDLKF